MAVADLPGAMRRMIAGTGVDVRLGDLPKAWRGRALALYSPRTDRITQSAPGHAGWRHGDKHRMLHELAHATGHRTRLGRRLSQDPWEYAREEVVAELAASRIARRIGLGAMRLGSPSGRQYIRAHTRRLAAIRGAKGRTPAEASAIVRDARAAENYLMTLAEGRVLPGRVRRILERRRGRGRPVRGGGA